MMTLTRAWLCSSLGGGFWLGTTSSRFCVSRPYRQRAPLFLRLLEEHVESDRQRLAPAQQSVLAKLVELFFGLLEIAVHLLRVVLVRQGYFGRRGEAARRGGGDFVVVPGLASGGFDVLLVSSDDAFERRDAPVVHVVAW
jgi:hypothetical protein